MTTFCINHHFHEHACAPQAYLTDSRRQVQFVGDTT